MNTPATPSPLEILADDVALMRAELRSCGETLARLDNGCAALAERLIAMRDETQDARAELRDMRRELAAHNRRQQKIGERLARAERQQPLTPRWASAVVSRPNTSETK